MAGWVKTSQNTLVLPMESFPKVGATRSLLSQGTDGCTPQGWLKSEATLIHFDFEAGVHWGSVEKRNMEYIGKKQSCRLILHSFYSPTPTQENEFAVQLATSATR